VELGFGAFERAMDGFEEMIRRVPDDRWDSASPCEGWSGRDVAGHVISEIHWAAALIAGTDASASAESDNYEPPVAAWESARRRLEAVCTPESLERRVPWPFGEQSVDRGLGLFSLEILVHTWDIARSAALDVRLDPGLVHDHFVRLQRVGHLLRGPGMYGPAVAAPPDSDEQDRLLAFLGRQVA
jgi:uncharacterized protein (TIGR03086 family)